jgi:hypothetical protein
MPLSAMPVGIAQENQPRMRWDEPMYSRAISILGYVRAVEKLPKTDIHAPAWVVDSIGRYACVIMENRCHFSISASAVENSLDNSPI